MERSFELYLQLLTKEFRSSYLLTFHLGVWNKKKQNKDELHCTILKDVSWGLGIVDGFVGRWEWGEEQKGTKKKETSSKCHWWFSSQEKISQGKLDFNCKDSLIPEGISNVAVSLLYSKLWFWSCILWETPFFSSLSRLTWKRRYWNCFNLLFLFKGENKQEEGRGNKLQGIGAVIYSFTVQVCLLGDL